MGWPAFRPKAPRDSAQAGQSHADRPHDAMLHLTGPMIPPGIIAIPGLQPGRYLLHPGMLGTQALAAIQLHLPVTFVVTS